MRFFLIGFSLLIVSFSASAEIINHRDSEAFYEKLATFLEINLEDSTLAKVSGCEEVPEEIRRSELTEALAGAKLRSDSSNFKLEQTVSNGPCYSESKSLEQVSCKVFGSGESTRNAIMEIDSKGNIKTVIIDSSWRCHSAG